MLHNDVLDFISHFSDGKDMFLHGQCYYFMLILADRFHEQYICIPCYNEVRNHFALLIDGTLYDASGAIDPDDDFSWVMWKKYVKREPLGAKRVWRDCVLQVSPEQLKTVPKKQRRIKK